MFSLTIVFGPGPMVWTLMYKTEETARAHRDFLQGKEDTCLRLTDDFGQEAELVRSSIHGTMFEDMEISKLAHIERALHQARTKVKADELAQADPVIRSAAMRQGGAILQPAMPGMPFQQNGRMS
jgi:hypothetical protein